MVVVTTHQREAVHGQVYQEFLVCHDRRARYPGESGEGTNAESDATIPSSLGLRGLALREFLFELATRAKHYE
jgi:hypothetical protein